MLKKAIRDSGARDLFLQRVRDKGHTVVADAVIARDNVYRVDAVRHLMVRTSRFHESRGVYFFGLTRHIFENFAQLPDSVIAFVFSDTLDAILVPASWMWEQRDKLSADAKQFKLEIDKSLRLSILKGAGRPIDLSAFHDQFDMLSSSVSLEPAKIERKAVSDEHAALQGMLLEVGNGRGFQTYCANKAPRFKGKSLGQIATLADFPSFPGLNTDILRNIDVIWLDKSFPTHAFEVELTTGIWTGLVRLGELRRLNTLLYVVTDGDDKAFKRRISGDIFSEIIERCRHANAAQLRELHEAERHLHDLRKKLFL